MDSNIEVGEIWLINIPWFNPSKEKFCIFILAGYFFVINSKNNYPFSHPILKKHYKFLKRDSYISCSILLQLPEELPLIHRLGALTIETMDELIRFIPSIDTLSKIDQDKIINSLTIKIKEIKLSKLRRP